MQVMLDSIYDFSRARVALLLRGLCFRIVDLRSFLVLSELRSYGDSNEQGKYENPPMMGICRFAFSVRTGFSVVFA